MKRLILVLAIFLAVGSASQAQLRTNKFALLVGCTEYPNLKIDELWGPFNDVRLFGDLLEKKFGFAPANVQRLAGWPENPNLRPTYLNIKRGFESLIAGAGPG